MKIVYEVTRNYYDKILPSIRSLLEHNAPEVIYVLAEDDEVPGLPDVCKVINVSDQKWIRRNSPNWNNFFTWIILLRVCFTEVLPDCDKVIQMDADTIICDSLEPVWNTDVEGKWFAAVQEYEGLYKPYRNKYYNAGVMLMNLKQMREDGITKTFLDEINTKKYRFPEQDILNRFAVPEGKATDLPVRYNESFCCGYTLTPAVVHYAGVGNWYGNRSMYRWEYLFRYMKNTPPYPGK